MTAFSLFQFGFDAALFGAVLYLLLTRAKQTQNMAEERSRAALSVLEAKIQQWEQEMADFRKAKNEQLAQLKELCDKAARVLLKNVSSGVSSDDERAVNESWEAQELRAAVEPKDEIPSLKQIEKTRQRLHSEMQVNLKALLSEQLL